MASYTPLDQAGPQRLPAAVLHPGDPFPGTWNIVATWTYRRQQGAWVERVADPGYGGRYIGMMAQVVYHSTAPRSTKVSAVATALIRASGRLGCPWRAERYRRGDRNPEWTERCAIERQAYYASGPGVGIDIVALDNVTTQAVYTAQQQRMAAHRAAHPRAYRDESEVMPALSGPPEPGMERIEWLAKHITNLVPLWAELDDLAPHVARRAAARSALARVAGYEASRAGEDAHYLAAGALHLASLNEYARRVLDQGEATREEGADHAVL